MINKRLLTIASLLFCAILTRFLPHLPNFTAMSSIALFSAASFNRFPMVLLSTFLSLFLSDCLLGFYPDMSFVYLSYGAIILIGRFLAYKHTWGRTSGAIVLSSATFFLITNFGVWLSYSLYPPTFSGLLLCYAAAVPFAINQFLGDLLYGVLLFGCSAMLFDEQPDDLVADQAIKPC